MCPASSSRRCPKCLWSQSLPQAPAGSSCWAGGAQGTLLWVVFAHAGGAGSWRQGGPMGGGWAGHTMPMVTVSIIKTASLKPQVYPKSKQSWLMGGMDQFTALKDKSGKEALKKKPCPHVLCILLLSYSSSCKMLRKLQCCSCEQWGWRETGQAGCGCQEQPQHPWTQHCTRPWAEAIAAPRLLHSLGHPTECRTPQHFPWPVNNTGKKAAKIQVRFSITHMKWQQIKNRWILSCH